MKALIKKIFVLFLLVIAYNSASAEIQFFSGWASKNGKVYRVANVDVYFENIVTRQRYRAKTNYWGQYYLALEEGQYKVKAVLPGSQLVFKSVFNVPGSDGIIPLNAFHQFSGQLHSTEETSNFDGYTIQANRKTENGEQISYDLKVESSGTFSANLQAGVYECLIFDNKGKLNIETEITIEKEKTMDFMVMSKEPTSPASTTINDNNTPTKISKNKKSAIEDGTLLAAGVNNGGLYNLISVIIISIVQLFSV